MKFPSLLRRLRNTQGGMGSTAKSASTPYTPSTLQVTVTASAPTVYRGVRITFTGRVENAPEGVTLSYSWTFGEGATDIEGADGLTPSCVYTTPGDKTVTLTVSDGNTVLGSGSVTITVGSPPLPWRSPIAHAGSDQIVALGSEVSFSGADSTAPYGRLTYSWTFGANADPATSDAEMPFCIYNKPGTKTVTLTVTDSATELTDSDEVIINVKPPPEAEAGDPQTVGVSQKVCFDGSGSTGINLSYLWDFGDDYNPTAGSDKKMASHSYLTKGPKTATLTVTDKDTGLKHSDTVTINVKPPPEAEAGDPQTVGVNQKVCFDGSDSKGTNLSYSWVFGADAAPLTGSGETPSCTYSAHGAKTVSLTVTDEETGFTDRDDVTINVEPVANAGNDQTVGVGDTVSFDGSGSIGTNLSYSWDFGDDATPATGSGETPSCTYSAHGAKKVILTVMNTVTKVTDSDEVIINVEPVARAGSNQIVAVNTAVNFDGSGSVGTDLSYSWDFGDDATPATGSGATPSCTYSTTGTKTVTLTVTQGEGDQMMSDTDTLTVTVTSVEPRGVNNIERQALIYTFGDDVGEELAGLIEIRFNENVASGRVPKTVDDKINVSRIEFNPTHNTGKIFWLGIFIHEATHIWQRNTGLHLGRADGDYTYTLDQLHCLNFNLEEHALAVQDWFTAHYAYTNGIGDGPGKLSASSAWGGSLHAVLGYSHEAIGKMPDSEKIRVINDHYKRLIDQIRDSSLLPSTDPED